MNQTKMGHHAEYCGLGRFERRDLTWFFTYFAFYMFMFTSYIFAGVVRDEDLIDGKVGPEFLLNGRWMIWVMRQLTGGDAVNYPMSGIMAGAYFAAAIILLVKWLRIHNPLSRAVCGLVYFSLPQWIGMLHYQKMADAVALGILLCMLAAILIYSPGKRYIALSVLCCTLGIACYQTIALVFGVVVLTALLYTQRHNIPGLGFRYLLKASLVSFVSCSLYLCVTHIIKAYLPLEQLAHFAQYQASVVGWDQCTDVEQTWNLIWTYGVRIPLHTMFAGIHYLVAWAAMAVFLCSSLFSCGFLKTLRLTLLGVALLLLPYTTGLLLLSPVGMALRVPLAIPMASLCCVALMLGEGVMTRPVIQKAFLILCTLWFIKNSYRVSATAKNESYTIQTAVAELRDMNLVGRYVAANTAAQNGRILLCGFLPPNYNEDPRVRAKRPSSWNSSCASPFIFSIKEWYVRKVHVEHQFAYAARLPRLVVASAEEVAAHAETLQSMPIWPADGSVKVDGDVVLIKIWD